VISKPAFRNPSADPQQPE